MWGTPPISIYSLLHYRFIPTHVGNANINNPLVFWRSVHPHACGERSVDIHPSRVVHGSSPRMWGTRLRGKSRSTNKTVHPHACGERRKNGSVPVQLFGSSPRMWGTLGISLCVSLYGRFIPTHVGNAKWLERAT